MRFVCTPIRSLGAGREENVCARRDWLDLCRMHDRRYGCVGEEVKVREQSGMWQVERNGICTCAPSMLLRLTACAHAHTAYVYQVCCGRVQRRHGRGGARCRSDVAR
jgi:hypothetical protein